MFSITWESIRWPSASTTSCTCIERFLVAWGPRAPPRAPGGSMSYRQYCLLVLAAAAPALAQPSVDQILTAYAQALGGQAAYEKVSTRAMKGTVEIPDDNVTGTALVVAKAPGSFRLTMDIPGYGVVETVLDGGNGWEKNPDSGTHAMSKADLAVAQRDHDFYREVRFKELFPKIEAAGADKVGGRAVYVVEATPAAGPAEKLYFDRSEEH